MPPRKDNRTTEEAKAHYLNVLKEVNGWEEYACDLTEYDTVTIENWKETDRIFKVAVQRIKKGLVAGVEQSLAKEALKDGGNVVAKIFYLKTRAPERYGQGERVQIEPSKLWFERPETPTLPEQSENKG